MAENYISQLQAILRTTGLSQGEVAARLGVTHAALNRWLHQRAIPHPRHRLAIASLYKTLVGFRPLAPRERVEVLSRARALRRPRLWATLQRHPALVDELLLEHTYNSNAIEGSTLSKKETDAVIFGKSRLPDKSLVEHLEAINHAAVLRDLLLQKSPAIVTEGLIRPLHRFLLQGIREDAGEYAIRQRVIRGVNLALTHPKDIPEEMRGLLATWRRTRRRGYGVVEVAQFHADFELIHPFADGNGRVGRLVMVIQLLAANYPPVIIETARKAEYYEVLEYAQRTSVDPFVVFLVDEIERTAHILRRYRC